ncbi:MAG: DMT family transporter [Sphingomonadales bacterium]|nr:DMT family transporter [Sphingomonadales bacterium]
MLALGLRVIAAALIATMFMFGKLATESGVNLPEVMFWRQFVTLPMLGGYLLVTGGLGRLRTARIASHAKRAGMGMTGMFCNFAAVSLLPLAESTTFNFTAPLFAVLITALVLRDHVGPWRWTAVAFGFAGVLVITQPGHAHIPPLGAAAGMASALFNAVISFQIRDLGRTEEPIRVVFWFALFGSALMALFLPFFGQAHDAHQWFLLVSVGVFGTIAQLFMTAALRFGAVASVIVMDYTALIWSTLYGWQIWHQLPPATTWLGAPLIVAAGLVIAWREHRFARADKHAGVLDAD